MTLIPKAPETEDHRYRKIGLVVLASLMAVVIIWGYFAPLASAVSATGKVTVASNNRVIQHLEGGIVKAIHVADGEQVKKGDLLIELDTTRAKSELDITIAQYAELLVQEARLLAERDQKLSIVFPAELDTLCKETSCTTLIQSQQNEFSTRRAYIQGEIAMQTQKIEQLHHQLTGINDTLTANQKLSDSYAQEIKEWKILFDQQLTDKLKLRDMERQKIKIDGDILMARSESGRIKGEISELTIRSISIKQLFFKEVTEQLSEVQTHLSDLRSRTTALRDVLNRMQIISPVDGMVANLQLHTLGGVISSAKPILEIVPSNEKLIIDARISATEITNVHTGLSVEIRFPGFTHIKSLNIIEGEVTHISPDALSDETTGTLYYQIKVSVLPSGQQELIRHHLTLQPGIPAYMMIITGSRSMLEYLIQPLKNMFTKSFNEE